MIKINKNKKIAILVGDGMADYPMDELDGKTPLESANTPNMDFLAANGILGMTRTIPEGMQPGSDVANLSIFGYDPSKYFTGRAPLEALSMGIELENNDAAFRCNIVNITDGIMRDYSAGQIETGLSQIIIDGLRKEIKIKDIEFYPGVSYRNLLVWRNFPYRNITATTPPHDIQDKNIADYMPRGEGSDVLSGIMEKSFSIIAGSETINKKKTGFRGKPGSVWLWGGGRKPAVETLKKTYGLHGNTISAVDLIHGIGRAAGLSPIQVKGATGYIDTNYSGKAEALLKAIKKSNFIFLHVEAPDESGHEGNLEHKIKSIEDFDKMVVGRVTEELKEYSDYAILVMPDHPTPIRLKTHSADPVPFCIYSNKKISGFRMETPDLSFTEKKASSTGNFVEKAHNLIEIMISEGRN